MTQHKEIDFSKNINADIEYYRCSRCSKYKKVIDKSASSESVKVDYNNGNFYHLEKDNVLGYKKYHKYFDGSEYINVVEKK